MIMWRPALLLLIFGFDGCPSSPRFHAPIFKDLHGPMRLCGGGIPKKRVGEFAAWGADGKQDSDFVEDIGAGRPLKDGNDPATDKWFADDPYNNPMEDDSYQVARYKSSKDPVNRMEILRTIEKVRGCYRPLQSSPIQPFPK